MSGETRDKEKGKEDGKGGERWDGCRRNVNGRKEQEVIIIHFSLFQCLEGRMKIRVNKKKIYRKKN